MCGPSGRCGSPAATRAASEGLAGALGAVALRRRVRDVRARGADIVCAYQPRPTPVGPGQWLDPGTHVTSVRFDPAAEVDEVAADAVARALVVVESRAAALATVPVRIERSRLGDPDGVIGPDHIHAEIGELRPGHRGPAGPRPIR